MSGIVVGLAQMIARSRELHVIARQSALDKAATPEERKILEERFRTGDTAVYEESRDNSGGTSESKGYVMPWNRQ